MTGSLSCLVAWALRDVLVSCRACLCWNQQTDQVKILTSDQLSSARGVKKSVNEVMDSRSPHGEQLRLRPAVTRIYERLLRLLSRSHTLFIRAPLLSHTQLAMASSLRPLGRRLGASFTCKTCQSQVRRYASPAVASNLSSDVRRAIQVSKSTGHFDCSDKNRRKKPPCPMPTPCQTRRRAV